MEQVPDDLHPGLLGGLDRRNPARPGIFARRSFNQVPAQAVAKRAQAELGAQAIVRQRMLVVRRRPDEVEPDAVAAPMRRAFEAALEKTVEAWNHLAAH